MGTWQALSLRQRIIALVTTVGVVFGLFLLASLAGRENQALLFAGMDPAVAGEVATQLDGMGIPYTVQGSAIMVPVSQRDRLRLEMARQGLPAANSDGYELLDNLNGFSTTADMFDAAYWRAKEGELTRTIGAMPSVRAARVHLGVTRNSAFRRSRDDKSASVTVDAPFALTREQATSIQYLTALAVPELQPDNVAVIDSQRGVIAGPGGPDETLGNADTEAREIALSDRLTRLLEAHVGLGNAEVTVALELNHESMAQTERLIDPNSRQVATRNILEERDTETAGDGVVTVASNLPDGEANDGDLGDPNSPVMRAKRNEEVVFTGTEIERITQREAGAISRLSVAVLLNERFTTDDTGARQLDPRSPEELQAIETLVASAAGIDVDRGDQLSVQILPFEVMPEDNVATPGFVDQFVMPQIMQIAQLVFLGLIVIVVALFVLKPALTPAPRDEELAALESGEKEPVDAATLLTMLTQENPDDAIAILDEWFEEEREVA